MPPTRGTISESQKVIALCAHCLQKNRLIEKGELGVFKCGGCRMKLGSPFTYVVFDCETTGLLSSRARPHLVQLAWSVLGADGILTAERNYIVKPSGFSIPESATRVHGITDSEARRSGAPLATVIQSFLATVGRVGVRLVSHNIDFDTKVLEAECDDIGLRRQLSELPRYCTMRNTTKLCRIPRRGGGYKWPSLQELHLHLFGRRFQGGHNAMKDVQATARCFTELRRRKFVQFN